MINSSKLLSIGLFFSMLCLFTNCAKDPDDSPEPVTEIHDNDHNHNNENSSDDGTGNEENNTNENGNALDYLASENDFSLFYSAIVKAEFQDELDSDRPITIFAPDNDAWQNLLDNNGWNSNDDVSSSVLNTILKFHVSTEGEYFSADFTNGQQITIMYQDRTVSINLNNPEAPQIILGLSKATIIDTDVSLKNGVLHKIDGVLSL